MNQSRRPRIAGAGAGGWPRAPAFAPAAFPVSLPFRPMLVDVAMDVLGLSGETTPAEVRRAYLRQVKAHPPERVGIDLGTTYSLVAALEAQDQALIVALREALLAHVLALSQRGR